MRSTLRRIHWLILATIVLYALVIRVILINEPFSRNAEGTGSYYGQLARNYLRLPFSTTHGVPVQSVHPSPDEPLTFYPNHPPLVPLLIAGSYSIFGDGTWQTRLPTVVFTLGCLLLIFHILQTRGHPVAGLIASAIFAMLPMTIFYGGHPDCINPQLIFFVLLTLHLYERFQRDPRWQSLAWMMIAFLPAAWTDWPAYYVVPVVCGHFALTHHPKKWFWIVPFGVVSVLLFCVVYGHIATTIHDWQWMGKQLERRTISSESDRTTHITARTWVAGVMSHNVKRHTWPVLGLALVWIVGWGWRTRSSDRADTFIRLIFAYALLHVLIGRQAVFVHDWWWWPLTPALVLACGRVIEAAMLRLSEKRDRVPSRQLARIPLIATTLLIVAFGFWTTRSTLPIFLDTQQTRGGVTFSTSEIGEAIRLAAPDQSTGVFVAYNDTYDLPLWFYGDRALKLGVWDQWTLEQRLDDGRFDLPFGFTQRSVHPAVAYIMPSEFISSNTQPFVDYLRARYSVRETEKFLIFDLMTAKTGR